MNPHRPRKPASDENTTDEEEMIVYDVEDEIETNLDYGCDHPNPSSSVLSHSEIHSLHRAKRNLTRRNPPAYHWYAAKGPGLSLQCRRSRALQTVLACLRSDHLRDMTFVQG
ncbi:uncharacterized protein TNCV_315211 [Trichonephila clavipes]|nr:uncharacterized protein TNCV_315211 [Trichonephila clavipes]